VLWIGTVIAKGQSWAPAAVSGVLIAAAVPAIVVGPVAGVFVDRWDHRRIMLVSEVGRGILVLALLPLAWPSVAGRVVAVINPLQQVATVVATAAAGPAEAGEPEVTTAR
jgi:MFS family permease